MLPEVSFSRDTGGRPACPTGAWCPSWNLGGRRAPGVPCRRADTHVCGFSAGKTCGSPDPRRAPRPGAGGARGLTAATTLPHGPKPRWGRASGQCPRGLPRSLPGGRPPLPCTHGAGSSVCFGVTAQHPRDPCEQEGRGFPMGTCPGPAGKVPPTSPWPVRNDAGLGDATARRGRLHLQNMHLQVPHPAARSGFAATSRGRRGPWPGPL